VDTYLTTMQVAALSIAGMCHALLGSIKVPLARQLQIDESRMGGLVSVFGFTLIPMAFAAGIFSDSLGRDTVIAGGCLLLILSVVVLAHLKSYRMAVVSVLLLGTGWSALVNVLNATQGPSFLSIDEISKANLPFAMNLGDFVFGLGAFVMPVAATMALRRVGLKKTFLVFAALIAIPLVLSMYVDVDSFVKQFGEIMKSAEPVKEGAAKVGTELGFADLLGDKVVMFCCLAFFFHVPVEACVATWATTLMIDRGVRERNANLLLSAFWLTFTVSRLIAALSIPAGTDHGVVIGLAAATVLVVLGLVVSRRKLQTSILVIAAGLILGPIFPILIAFLVGQVDVSMQGRAIGLFFCIGGIGWAVVPLLVGKLADMTSLKRPSKTDETDETDETEPGDAFKYQGLDLHAESEPGDTEDDLQAKIAKEDTGAMIEDDLTDRTSLQNAFLVVAACAVGLLAICTVLSMLE
jgi:fucose permease